MALTASGEWRKLLELKNHRETFHLADLPARELCAEATGILLDLSRQRLDDEVLAALIRLLEARGFHEARAALWRGDAVNHTEGRAALHMLLRADQGDAVGTMDAREFAFRERERMRAVAEEIRSARRFEHVVHVGIGGSHLGPALAVDVLEHAMPDTSGPEVHFASNTDPAALMRLMRRLPRERTLLVLVSKSFTTRETSLIGDALLDWLSAGRERAAVLREQVIAVSANIEAMNAAGIPGGRQLLMSDWAGGRFSLWSPVGISVALRFGWEAFAQLLEGARAMDRHFLEAPLDANLPVLLALAGIWNINFLDARSHAVLPYAEALAQLPAYLQQLEMESNGKSVDRDGRAVDYRTAPVIWGGVGMNGQHAFFQQLHQGTDLTSMDFIVAADRGSELPQLGDCLAANVLAQAEALMRGRDETRARSEDGDDPLRAWRLFPGNRPSSMIVPARLDAFHLGALLAMYEHKVFTQSVVWNVNPFDQFGVELGKSIAKRIEPLLQGAATDGVDAITQRLIARLKR